MWRRRRIFDSSRLVPQSHVNGDNMSKASSKKDSPTYDFRDAKRGAVLSQSGKTRITILVDTDTLDAFRAIAEREGRGYQTLMNEALRGAVSDVVPLEERVRSVLREELGRLRAS